MTRTDNNFPVRITAVILLIAGLQLAITLPAFGQSAVSSEAGVTLEMLESRFQETDASAELDEANKTKLLDYYRKAISLVEQQRSYEVSTLEFIKARESAPRQAERLRKQLEKLESRSPQKLPDSLLRKKLPQLEQQLLGEKADLTGLTTRLWELEVLLETQATRSQQVRERLNEAKQRQPEVADALQTPTPEGELNRLVEARRWSLEHDTRALVAEIEMLDQELLSQPMRGELLGVQRDKATLELNRQQNYVQLLESKVVERRQSDAETVKEETAETERQSFGKHTLLQELAQKNSLLSEELNALVTELENITAEENAAASRAKRIDDNFRLARQKLDIAGLSEALGQVLLEQRRGLPDSGDFKAAEERRKRLLIESSLRQIRNQQERARLRDINLYVDDLMLPLSETWNNLLRDDVLALAELRRDLLDKAIAADDTYLQTLGELDFTQRNLTEIATAYNKFLNERLLWIRTGKLPSWETLDTVARNIGVFFSPEHWLELGSALLLPDSFPWVLLIGLAIFALLLKKTPALRASLERSGRNVGQLRHDRFITTLRALILTLVLALPWPILFTALGLHLQYVQNIESLDLETHIYRAAIWTGEFAPAIGAAFYEISLYFFYFIAFRVFCERDGLAVAHFGWSTTTTDQLREDMRRLMSVFLPSGFFLIAAISYDPAAQAGGLSRLFFVIVMVALAWFFGRILMPRRGALREFYAANPGNLLTWFRYLWLGLGLAIPVILAVLAVVGYVYTAAEFSDHLINTVWMIVAIILINQLVVRWILLTERRLAFNDALERHRAQRAAKESAENESAPGEVDPLQFEEPEIDFGALSDDTTKLIRTALVLVAAVGLWVIWSPVLPAFGILDTISLWQYSTVVDGVEKLASVTLKDLILGLLTILIIIAGARRLPALLEIVLLARLNITAGSRYAITTLTQYAIIAIGVVLVFSLLGGKWSEIQWLIAALGIGIGFGLQEIVANFICGLILLFERPIRIGDVVTVGDTDGVVTKIRIRSTTIRGWDQKELLVPNKEFITGRLLNWTLSDPVTRIVIPVGIAYGSDVTRAIQLVQEAADQHERVIDEPPYKVTFENFADSSLTIMLRCFVGSMDYWRQTTSELNQAINNKFTEAGIVIAFPQRDIHLDASQPLDVRIHRVSPDET
ncbi:MAG: mechanosensitive ion channel [Gammaproteobacteria bacterium]|nr:mechanosensitive ion channel [Gammaproteobacteria bacterium]